MDKIKSLYESYIAEGVISPSTTLEQFTSANEEQQSTLYNQGIQANVLSQETDFDLFKSAWDLKKKKIRNCHRRLVLEMLSKNLKLMR